jgi:hypothetical protein
MEKSKELSLYFGIDFTENVKYASEMWKKIKDKNENIARKHIPNSDTTYIDFMQLVSKSTLRRNFESIITREK